MVKMFKKITFFYVGLLVAVIFAAGISAGLNYDSLRIGSIEKETKILSAQIEDFVVTNELIRNLVLEDCKLIEPYLLDIAKQSEDLGNSLQNFESKRLVANNEYDRLRESYFLNELQYWMTLERYKECDPEIVTILFFYGDNDDSVRQGFVLTEIRKESTGKIFVFSFDIETINSNSVKVITSVYGVKQSPSMVINSKELVEGFAGLNYLKDILKQL